MTVAELMQSVVEAGFSLALAVAILPMALGGVAYLLRQAGNRAGSQRVANLNIGLGLFSVLVIILWTIYAAGVKGMLGSTNVLVFIGPLYWVGVGFVAEHLLHPGEQEQVRKRIRSVLVFIAILGVLYFVLSRLNMHMVIWTNVLGFVFFVVVLIGILYALIRKVV